MPFLSRRTPALLASPAAGDPRPCAQAPHPDLLSCELPERPAPVVGVSRIAAADDLAAPAAASPSFSATTPNTVSAAHAPLAEPSPTAAARHGRDAPIVRLLDALLADAARRNASDLHIEPTQHGVQVRMRIDGVLHVTPPPPSHWRDALVARIKALSGLDIAERRLPQDGRLSRRVTKDRLEQFRVSTLPTAGSEKVVLRRLDTLPDALDLGTLGLDRAQRATLEEALQIPHGLIVVTGPTGSGKTLTLFSLLQALNGDHVNICTVEDPVEIRLPGVTQVSVRERHGLGFAAILRALLRQDPDIIMVGEIRDADTADIAVKAAQTGHLVLSSVHTNDAASTVVRLRDLGVAPYKLAASLRVITAQRLVRRLCTACRVPDALARQDPALDTIPHVWRAVGCAACHGIGYRGRLGIHEVVPVSARTRELIASQADAATLRAASRTEGARALSDAALDAVAAGFTSLTEAYRAVGKLQ